MFDQSTIIFNTQILFLKFINVFLILRRLSLSGEGMKNINVFEIVFLVLLFDEFRSYYDVT